MQTFHSKYLSALVLFLFLAASQTVSSQQNKPNIILIFADDLGIESLKPYGGHSTVTPNIDKLADSGMLFTHCIANPACSPSRAEILTGTYPTDNGIKHVLTYFKDETFLDPDKFKSFANQLKTGGYATAIAGKWNLSYLEKNNTIKAFGFDEHCLWQMYNKTGVKRSRYYQPYFRINNTIVEDEISNRFGPDVMADFLIDFITKNQDKPFLIYYPSLIPHVPFVKVPGNKDAEILPDHQQKNGPECFPEMVNYLDQNVGRLVSKVEELGIADNTILIFCADNGTDKRVISVWGEDKVDLPGGKMTMTDRGTRVPLIVKWPGKIRAGSRCNDLVELADFLPTFCNIASVPIPKQSMRGQSFYSQLIGEKGDPRKYVHIEYQENSQIRTKKWIYTNNDKLIRINKYGTPENMPKKEGSHKKTREELRNIIEQISKVKHE